MLLLYRWALEISGNGASRMYNPAKNHLMHV